jgi:hypothetical protein
MEPFLPTPSHHRAASTAKGKSYVDPVRRRRKIGTFSECGRYYVPSVARIFELSEILNIDIPYWIGYNVFEV